MRLALELHLERFAVVAFAVARLARHVDVGEEVHLDLDQAVALARLAPAALDVEAEAARLVAARLAFGQAGEPVADVGEGAGIGRGVRARRAPDRRLVDVDDLVAIFEAGDLVMMARDDAGAVQCARGGGVERVDREARLAAARNAGDAGEGAERDRRGDVGEIVCPRAVDGDFLARSLAALGGDLDLARAVEIIGGERVLRLEDPGQRALGDDLAAVDARAGAHVEDIVGGADRVLVMFDDDDGVAEIAQAAESDQQAVVVALMQADARFIQYVQNAGQSRTYLAREADALALAARQGARWCGRG